MNRERMRRRLLWSGPVVGLLAALLLNACSSATARSPSAAASSPAVAVRTGSPSGTPLAPAATVSPISSRAPAPTLSPEADTTFVGPGGDFAVQLASSRWTKDDGADSTALYLTRTLPSIGPQEPTLVSIRLGDAEGRITTCDREPQGPYALQEECRRAIATSTEELASALGYAFVDFAELSLDGEPAMSRDISGYEYPASGGQYLKYVLAMHDGRPVIVRFWTGNNGGLHGVRELLTGFRFLD